MLARSIGPGLEAAARWQMCAWPDLLMFLRFGLRHACMTVVRSPDAPARIAHALHQALLPNGRAQDVPDIGLDSGAHGRLLLDADRLPLALTIRRAHQDLRPVARAPDRFDRLDRLDA